MCLPVGGSITVESPPPGKGGGSVFTVRLPLWQADAGEFEEAKDAEPATSG